MPNYAPDLGEIGVSGPGFLPSAAFSLPDIPGLRGAYILGAGEELALTNLVEGGPVPIRVGSPVWENGYAALSRGNHINTGIAETAAMTLMMVSRRPTGVNAGFIGNYINDDTKGVGIYSLGSQQTMTVIADRGTAGAIGTSIAAIMASWGLYSASIPAAGAMTMRNHTAGTSAVGTSTAARVVESGGPILIGTLDTASFAGSVHIAVAMVLDRVLSAAELAEATAWAREAAAFGEIAV